MDPRRSNQFMHPTVRLLAEFLWGYVAAIRRAPLSAAERRECYRHLARWITSHASPAAHRALRGGFFSGESVAVPPPTTQISLEAIVAGRERNQA